VPQSIAADDLLVMLSSLEPTFELLDLFGQRVDESRATSSRKGLAPTGEPMGRWRQSAIGHVTNLANPASRLY
jgi:hypothetical protein